MEFFKEWAFSICCALIIGGILNMILPSGNMQKIFKTVLCIFFICVVAAPITEIDFSKFRFDYSNSDILEIQADENEFNKISAEYFENEIIKATNEILKNENLQAEDIYLKINISENGSIDINKFALRLYYSENIDKLEEKIRIKTGLTPEIIISEDN